MSLTPFSRWGDLNSERTGYLSQGTPLIRSQARMEKPDTRPQVQDTLWGSPLLRNRWSANSVSFAPLLSSKLRLQLPLFSLCPASIWLWDFYLPAFVFDIMIRQYLIWSLALIYFSGTDPRDQLKGTTHSHKISMAWFLSELSDTRVHHSFPNQPPSTPCTQHMDTTFVGLLPTCLQYQFYIIELGTVHGKD